MKKLITLLLIFTILGLNSNVLALEKPDIQQIQQSIEGTPVLTVHEDAPIWADYVSPKYRNPRKDLKKGGSIAELITGIALTELLITAPVGIPLIVHGTTKIKMVSYANRKDIFDEEIQRAKIIEDDNERNAAYREILEKCNLKESSKEYYAKKEAKAKRKAAKKASKLK